MQQSQPTDRAKNTCEYFGTSPRSGAFPRKIRLTIRLHRQPPAADPSDSERQAPPANSRPIADTADTADANMQQNDTHVDYHHKKLQINLKTEAVCYKHNANLAKTEENTPVLSSLDLAATGMSCTPAEGMERSKANLEKHWEHQNQIRTWKKISGVKLRAKPRCQTCGARRLGHPKTCPWKNAQFPPLLAAQTNG